MCISEILWLQLISIFTLVMLTSAQAASNGSDGYFTLQDEVYLSEEVLIGFASSCLTCGIQCHLDTRCAGFSYHQETATCNQHIASCSLLGARNESVLASNGRHRHSLNTEIITNSYCNQSSYGEDNKHTYHSCLQPSTFIHTTQESSPWVEIVTPYYMICEVTFKMGSPSVYFPAVRFDTPDASTRAYQYPIGLHVGNQQQILFSVQACHDAHVSLQPDSSTITSSAYEIVLGGWTSSDHGCAIRRLLGGTQLVRIYEAGVVSCDEDRPFWISWNDGIIRVGTGHVIDETSLLMEYTDINPYLVSAVAVFTGWGSVGTWTFHSTVIPIVSVLGADGTERDCTLQSTTEFSYSCGHAGTRIKISTDLNQQEVLKMSEIELMGWGIRQ